MGKFRALGLSLAALTVLWPASLRAHPHVFIDANMELVRNAAGQFTEIRHVWRFDELFSATLILDFDENGNNVLDEAELKKVTSIVKESIAEYDYYTAVRLAGRAVELYEPESINAYYEDGRLIMFLSLEFTEPLKTNGKPVRLSASDTSFYVAFDFDKENITIEGSSSGCSVAVDRPDYDSLLADNSMTLSETFFADPSNASGLGDEFYTWASVSC